MKRTIVIKCERCEGTGIIPIFGGACQTAFVCRDCGGTGKKNFSYEEFEGRKEVDGIKRVFPRDPISNHHGKLYKAEDEQLESGEVLHFSQYGCDYQAFLKGEQPKPMEELYCPNYYEAGNEGVCSRCAKGLFDCGYGHPLKCLFWKDKAKCWEEYYKKHGKK